MTSSPCDFFAFARERYMMKLRRESGGVYTGPPWTDDPVLARHHFCNIFREDDRTTRYIREHVSREMYGEQLVGAMVIARWFNRIDTIRLLHSTPEIGRGGLNDLLYCWHRDLDGWESTMREVLRNVSPLVTGAYMIKTPAGMNKLDGVLWCLRKVLPDAVDLYWDFLNNPMRLREATTRLSQYPYLGPFMAYEIVCDLRWTVLHNAPDIMTWANPGPGCARGLGRLLYVDAGHYNRHLKRDQEDMQHGMRAMLELSQDNDNWPSAWPQWEMREVEHTLCEYDKYCRGREGGRLKRLYQPQKERAQCM